MSTFSWGRVYPTGSEVKVQDFARDVNIQAANATPIQVDAGYKHSLALYDDGTVWSWGSNSNGQLGRTGSGALPAPLTFTGSDASRIAFIASGALHSIAVTSGGAVYEWGYLFEGTKEVLPGEADQQELPGMANRLGRNEFLRRIVMRSQAAYLANADVSAISMTHTTAASDDTVTVDHAGGDRHAGQTHGSTGAGAVRAGTTIAHADTSTPANTTTTDGATTASATSESKGAGGDASHVNAWEVLRLNVKRVPVSAPRRVGALHHVSVRHAACGYAHSILVDSAGRMYAAGYNDRGQLGLGTRIASDVFRPILHYATAAQADNAARLPLADIVRVACGQQHNLACSASGQLFAWGSGALGQLGIDTLKDRLAPTLVPSLWAAEESMGRVVDVACGANHSLALTVEGEVLGFGHSEYNQMGQGTKGGDMTHTARFYYVPRLMHALKPFTIKRIFAGGQFSLATLEDGSAVTWGWDAYHCLGWGTDTRDGETFKRVAGMRGYAVSSASCGYHHALACVQPDGNIYAASWLPIFTVFNPDVSKIDDNAASAGDKVPISAAKPFQGKIRRHNPTVSTAEGDVEIFEPEEDVLAKDDEEATILSYPINPDVDMFGASTEVPGTTAGRSTTSSAELVVPPADLLHVAKTIESAGLDLDSHTVLATATAASTDKVGRLRFNLLNKISQMQSPGRSTAAAALKAVVPPVAAVVHKEDEKTVAAAPVKLHSTILAARCPVVGKLMNRLTAQVRAGAAVVGEYVLSSPLKNVRGCDVVTVSVDGSLRHWTVTFPGIRRSVLLALAAYLYSDRMVHIPEYRITQLKSLAQALHLERLAALCDKVIHAYDRPSAPKLGAEPDVLVVPSTYVDDMRKLLTAPALTDIKVEVYSEDLPVPAVFACHSAVLCRGDYFAHLLSADFADAHEIVNGHKVIRLHDVQPSEVSDLIEYLYTGDLSQVLLDAERCMRLLALAAQWCFPRLVNLLQDNIMQRMMPEDARICLEYATAYELPRLRQYAAGLLRDGLPADR